MFLFLLTLTMDERIFKEIRTLCEIMFEESGMKKKTFEMYYLLKELNFVPNEKSQKKVERRIETLQPNNSFEMSKHYLRRKKIFWTSLDAISSSKKEMNRYDEL